MSPESDEVMALYYHWTIKVLEFYKENNIKVIDWPPYSPDLNLIENVWAIMKKELNGRKFTTITSLKNELFKIWGQIGKVLKK